jgi:hypothetical protein
MTKRIADMTPEQAERHRKRRRQKIDAMTPEERERKRARARREGMTPEQLEHYRTKQRENAKRLGLKHKDAISVRRRAFRIANLERCRAEGRKHQHRIYAKKKRIREAKLFADANAAVPLGMPDREDVRNNILMAVHTRKLKAADIAKRAREFIRAYNRDNDHFKTVSLNECLSGTDLARIDSITAEDLPW